MTNRPYRTPDEGSVKGKGASIMLPSRGNPFAQGNESHPAPENVWAVGAEATAATAGAMAEPRDLTPEDLAAMFPSALAGQPGEQATPTAVRAAPPSHPPEFLEDTLAPAMNSDQSHLAGVETGMGPGPAGEGLALELHGVGFDVAAPPAAELGTAAMSGAVVTAATTTGASEGALTGQITEDVGLALTPYQRVATLPPAEALINLFVPDGRLMTLWLEIDSVEAQVTSAHRLSLKVAQELLDRLAMARNYLMHNRGNFEEARREVAEVKFRLARTYSSGYMQQPRPILAYLIAFLVLVAAGFVAARDLGIRLGNPSDIAGLAPGTLWYIMLWGGVGGVSGALYRLWRHVAQLQDYDPQHAQWYYLNPIMGLILGPLIALVAQLGLPAFVAIASTEAGSLEAAPALLYFLAWAVGFQQNLLFSLINAVLKRLTPAEPERASVQSPRR